MSSNFDHVVKLKLLPLVSVLSTHIEWDKIPPFASTNNCMSMGLFCVQIPNILQDQSWLPNVANEQHHNPSASFLLVLAMSR